MSRFSMVLAAAVTSAMIVVAVAALDAVGADKSNAKATNGVDAFAACLRDHGVQVPALTGVQLERWLKTHPMPRTPGVTCKTALAGAPPTATAAAKADAEKIAACLRAHGLNPPTAPAELKRWIVTQDDPEVTQALKECGLGPAPDCGGGKDELE
jgi:hypothetical protein